MHINSTCSTLLALTLLCAPAMAQEGVLKELKLPGLSNYAPAQRTVPLVGVNAFELLMEARLTEDSEPISQGMVWRVFGSEPNADGKLPLIGVAEGGGAKFQLEPGSYLVHAAFGRAGATARVTIDKQSRSETMVLNAGGLKLDATLPDGSAIRRNKLTFNVYEPGAPGEEDRLILPDVEPGRVIRLNAGTYLVVSKYGSINATIRAELRVEAGKTTEATVEHRAAQVTLNLVRSQNGFPLADTAWSVVAPSGDIIREDVGAVPSMILAAGEYTVIAKNRDRIYQRDIDVVAGRDMTVRVEAKETEGQSVQN